MLSRTIPAFAASLLAFPFLVQTAAVAQPGLTRLRDAMSVEADVEYGKAGTHSLELDVYRPKKEGGALRPAIVWIHGGGWQSGDKRSGAARLASFVAKGDYVGFSVGYRLTDVAPWPAQIHDCKAAIRFIRANAKKYHIDPDKIGVWGSSAGGHLVSLLGTSGDIKELEGENGSPDVSSRVACVVDFCGPSDFLAFGKDNPRMRDPGSPIYKLLGGPLNEKQEFARQASPVSFVSDDDPPFLIVHGTQDRTVSITQADRLAAKAKEAGINVTYVKIEGGGHGIGGTEVNARVAAFFDKHLLGKPIDVSAAAIVQQPAEKP